MNNLDSRISMQVGAEPHQSEISAVTFLINENFFRHVTFLAVSRIKNVRTPDIEADNNIRWEIKTPIGASSGTIKRAFKTAIRQSCYIIFDLRKSKLSDEINIARLNKEFSDIKKAKRLIVITKTKNLLDFKK